MNLYRLVYYLALGADTNLNYPCCYIIFYFLCCVEVLLYLTFFGSCKSPGVLNLEGHELYSAMMLCK